MLQFRLPTLYINSTNFSPSCRSESCSIRSYPRYSSFGFKRALTRSVLMSTNDTRILFLHGALFFVIPRLSLAKEAARNPFESRTSAPKFTGHQGRKPPPEPRDLQATKSPNPGRRNLSRLLWVGGQIWELAGGGWISPEVDLQKKL